VATNTAAARKPAAAPKAAPEPAGGEVIDLVPAWVMDGGAPAKLAWIQAHIGDVEKTGRNTHQKFDYFQEHGILALLRPYQKALHVAVSTSVIDVTFEGNMTAGTVVARLIDCDRTDAGDELRQIVERYPMQATDNQGWGAAKLLTYAKKFALQKMLGIPTDELPEAESEGITHQPGTGSSVPRKASKEDVAKVRQALVDASEGDKKFPQKVKAKLQADFGVETIDELTAEALPQFQQWVLDTTAAGK
jgi:hypothetical protein